MFNVSDKICGGADGADNSCAQLIRQEKLALKVFNISDKICDGADGAANSCALLIKQEKFSS